MADELQVALTSATPGPMETLKSDLGLSDKVESTNKVVTPSDDKESETTPKASEDEAPKEDDAETKPKEGEEDNTETDKGEPKKRNPYEQKIKRQAAANHRQTETINELKSRLAELEKAKAEPEKASGPVKPETDNFDSYEEYDKALSEYHEQVIEHKAEQKFAAQQEAVERERAQKEQEAKLNKIAEAFNGREEKFKATHKNYERNAQAMLETFDLLPPENAEGLGVLRQYLANSELGPNVIHHLGANPDLVEDITSADNVIDVARGIIEIENSVKGSSGSKKLPAPIGEIPRSNSGEKSLVDMDWNEMKKKLG